MTFQKTVKLIDSESWSPTERGNFLERVARQLLVAQRFEVIEQILFSGMEIDLLARNLDTQQRALVECKFRSRNVEGNTISAALGNAILKKLDLVYIFSTSEPTKDTKGQLYEHRNDPTPRGPPIAFVGPREIADMYVQVLRIREPNYDNIRQQYGEVGTLTLTILPDGCALWVLEILENGIPVSAAVIPTTPNQSFDLAKLKRDFDRLEYWQGLNITKHQPPKSNKQLPDGKPLLATPVEKEIVSRITSADQFDDYRPCRPADFVGRNDTQQEIWQFLERIREGQTSTRTLCLYGPSGFGKSSIVLKLADRFRNKKWKKKFFLYPVDSRSAKGPLFVLRAIQEAFHEAGKQGFLEKKHSRISFDGTDRPLDSQSIKNALSALTSTDRVLVVFFDQFEELFTKGELIQAFDLFRRVALEVDAAASNLVLGFSWRTGINFPDDHPGYFLWHELRDKRFEIRVNEFSSKEASSLITQLGKHIKQELPNDLRRRLMEQAQGLPWLLKKLCIHIMRLVRQGNTVKELLARHLDIKLLFDEDLEPLSKAQKECLRYIATHSPADILDVTETFGQDTPNWLYSNRLILRAGTKYTVYWDIFRDYLVTGEVPHVPMTYMMQSQPRAVLDAFEFIKKRGTISIDTLSKELRLTSHSTFNLMGDLLALMLAHREEDQVSVPDGLKTTSNTEVASHLAGILQHHVVFERLKTSLTSTDSLFPQEVSNHISAAYAAVGLQPKTVEVYRQRILPWLLFSGLLNEFGGGEVCLPPKGISKRGVWRPQPKARGSDTFLCASGPSQATQLANMLLDSSLDRKRIETLGLRNASTDLVTLGLATWKNARLAPLPLLSSAKPNKTVVEALVAHQASSAPCIRAASLILSEVQDASPDLIGSKIAAAVGRNWTTASLKRHGGAAKTWLTFLEQQGVRINTAPTNTHK